MIVLLGPAVASSQTRLVTRYAWGAGGSVDHVRFGGGGIEQTGFMDGDSVRVTSATQVTLPVAVATSLGGGWRLDVTALYAQGRVTARRLTDGAPREVRLGGLSDVRVRATGRVLHDGLIATAGLNVPTGRTQLTDGEYGALRVLVAPALSLGSTPVGTGPSGIVGLVGTRPVGPWTVALGGSLEHRGDYQPVAAITAGTEAANFRPGRVVRASMAAERLAGQHRVSLGVAADFFQADRLRGGAAASPSGNAVATVQLGPVLTADAQWQVASRRWRDLVVYGAGLWRASYARDALTVAGSSGHYVEGGLRGARPVRGATELVLATSARYHSGLSSDVGLATRGVRAADATVGLRSVWRSVSAQPYIRGQVGSLRARGGALPTRSFTGLTGGLVLQGRF